MRHLQAALSASDLYIVPYDTCANAFGYHLTLIMVSNYSDANGQGTRTLFYASRWQQQQCITWHSIARIRAYVIGVRFS